MRAAFSQQFRTAKRRADAGGAAHFVGRKRRRNRSREPQHPRACGPRSGRHRPASQCRGDGLFHRLNCWENGAERVRDMGKSDEFHFRCQQGVEGIACPAGRPGRGNGHETQQRGSCPFGQAAGDEVAVMLGFKISRITSPSLRNRPPPGRLRLMAWPRWCRG